MCSAGSESVIDKHDLRSRACMTMLRVDMCSAAVAAEGRDECGELAVSGKGDGTLRLWNTVSKNCIALSGNERAIIPGSKGETARLWVITENDGPPSEGMSCWVFSVIRTEPCFWI